MVNVRKDKIGRYVVSHKRKFGIGKGKVTKSLHFSRKNAINQAGAIVSVEKKRELRRKLK